jgi:alpha-glucosidase
MLYALRGTPFVYQGEELGLPDAEIPPERIVDVDGRDPERAPIPWRAPSEAGPGAGFTVGEPWLPVARAAEELAVERQRDDPRSTLALTRRLAWLRRAEPALRSGAQRTVDAGDDLLAWTRTAADGTALLILINFAARPRTVCVEPDLPSGGALVLSTDADRAPTDDLTLADLTLAPGEAVLVRL